jgi:hypothetical protein
MLLELGFKIKLKLELELILRLRWVRFFRFESDYAMQTAPSFAIPLPDRLRLRSVRFVRVESP